MKTWTALSLNIIVLMIKWKIDQTHLLWCLFYDISSTRVLGFVWNLYNMAAFPHVSIHSKILTCLAPCDTESPRQVSKYGHFLSWRQHYVQGDKLVHVLQNFKASFLSFFEVYLMSNICLIFVFWIPKNQGKIGIFKMFFTNNYSLLNS